MIHNLSSWNNPRASIANKYKNNDFAYVTRGANIALYIIDQFNIQPSLSKTMTVLDYGCGTGRATAFLSKLFKQSVGFDPNTNCIKVAHEENKKSDSIPTNIILTSTFNDVPMCDIAFSTNVIEHLVEKDAMVMIANLKAKVKGKCLIWYSPITNYYLKPYMDTDQWIQKENATNNGGRIQIGWFDFNQPAQPA